MNLSRHPLINQNTSTHKLHFSKGLNIFFFYFKIFMGILLVENGTFAQGLHLLS